MRVPRNERTLWLAVGLLAGVCVSYFWPSEPVAAVATDRDDKFAIATCTVTFPDTVEGVFVLDFLTGQLKGAALNERFGKFTNAWFRNVAADFQVDPQSQPHYVIVSGKVGLPGGRGVTPATSVIYVGELSSGKVIAYSFPYRVTSKPLPPAEMQPIDMFQFREAVAP